MVATILFTVDVRLGLGTHMRELRPELQRQSVRIKLIADPFAIMASSFPSIAVAIFLKKILAPSRCQTILLFGVAIVQCVIAGISCILLLAKCAPVEHIWSPDLETKCLPPSIVLRYFYFAAGESIKTMAFMLLQNPRESSH